MSETLSEDLDDLGRRLCELDEELREIALDREERALRPSSADLGAQAAAIYAARRRRARYFAGAERLFAEPAWDILLDLYVSELRERPTLVSSACIAADVPPTTALRWIVLLEKRGLVMRVPHPNDGRSRLLCLTETARVAIERSLADSIAIASRPPRPSDGPGASSGH